MLWSVKVAYEGLIVNWVPFRLMCRSTQTGVVEGRINIKSPAVIYHSIYHCCALQNNEEKPQLYYFEESRI